MGNLGENLLIDGALGVLFQADDLIGSEAGRISRGNKIMVVVRWEW